MNNEQTQQADDPSGDGWRDVGPDELLRHGDLFWNVDHWQATQHAGQPAVDERTYRRRIEPQQPSDSEPEIDHKQCVKALQQIAQLADTGSRAHRERFCPNGEGDGIANGWRVAEAMREIANDVVGCVSLPQQPSDSEPKTMEQLREQVRDLTRQAQFDAMELQQLREQVQTLTRERDRYRNQLAGAIEHSSAAEAQAQLVDRLQTWLRPVLEVVADHPDDSSILAVSVMEFLPQIASRLIEE